MATDNHDNHLNNLLYQQLWYNHLFLNCNKFTPQYIDLSEPRLSSTTTLSSPIHYKYYTLLTRPASLASEHVSLVTCPVFRVICVQCTRASLSPISFSLHANQLISIPTCFLQLTRPLHPLSYWLVIKLSVKWQDIYI